MIDGSTFLIGVDNNNPTPLDAMMKRKRPVVVATQLCRIILYDKITSFQSHYYAMDNANTLLLIVDEILIGQ